jgi:hypothetical protein
VVERGSRIPLWIGEVAHGRACRSARRATHGARAASLAADATRATLCSGLLGWLVGSCACNTAASFHVTKGCTQQGTPAASREDCALASCCPGAVSHDGCSLSTCQVCVVATCCGWAANGALLILTATTARIHPPVAVASALAILAMM